MLHLVDVIKCSDVNHPKLLTVYLSSNPNKHVFLLFYSLVRNVVVMIPAKYLLSYWTIVIQIKLSATS